MRSVAVMAIRCGDSFVFIRGATSCDSNASSAARETQQLTELGRQSETRKKEEKNEKNYAEIHKYIRLSNILLASSLEP